MGKSGAKTDHELEQDIALFLVDCGCAHKHELPALDDSSHDTHHVSRRWAGTDVQSLLFERPQWTASAAKKWATSHGYQAKKVHETDRYVRLRQFAPRRGHQKRTIIFGKGIHAVVEQR